METYSRIGSELAKESCSSSKSVGSYDKSLMGEKVSLIVVANSDILGVPRKCCRCLVGSLRFSDAEVMPMSFLTSFRYKNDLYSFKWPTFDS